MAIYKRGDVYWYSFFWNGKRIQESTKQGSPKQARNMMAAHRTALANGLVGIRERKRVTLADFLKNDFVPFVESKFKDKPATLRYYKYGAETLKAADFAKQDLSEICDQHGGQYAAKRKGLSASTVNCGLRTLRRAMKLAYEWDKIAKPAKITLAKGELQRERVLSDAEVAAYLDACPQPWKDVAIVMLGTGMRPSEVFALRWERVHLNGAGGLLQIAEGKSRAARRVLPIVSMVYAALRRRHDEADNPENGWLFPSESPSGHLEGYTAKNWHQLALKAAKLNDKKLKPFCPYTLRHTALTRLAESGCDAFTLARIAGHSSITITQRYCHPQADAIERAFAKLPASDVISTVAGTVAGTP